MEAKIPVTDVETSVGINDNDIVEVNVVEKDGIKQDDQIQKNEEDIKGDISIWVSLFVYVRTNMVSIGRTVRYTDIPKISV